MAEHHEREQENTPARSFRDGSVNTQRTNRPNAQVHGSKRSQPPNARPHAGARQRTNTAPPGYRPQYSLAGNNGGPQHEPHYVDKEYYDFNPNYQKPKDTPVWGLAKPLPRVKKGDPKKKSNRLGRNEEDRGYGHQQPERGRRRSYRSHRQDSENMILDHHGTPIAERDDPMDDWRSPQDDDGGDLGEQNPTRLPAVEEHASVSTLAQHATMQSEAFKNNENDYELDLERGDKMGDDEWTLSSEEAEQYIQEEKDNHNSWASIRYKFREPLAECLATMIAVVIGIATNLAVQTSVDTSGCVYRGFPTRKACIYMLAQILGGFLAGLIAYGIYQEAIAAYNSTGGRLSNGHAVNLLDGGTGTSFYTQPASFAGPASSFFTEFAATGILACTILALGDDSNAPRAPVCTRSSSASSSRCSPWHSDTPRGPV
ncbi:hypothetical protein NHQ30_011165 [Ciborinia camelliae]|nr:hypothetical protein NHQ30_011165 [Ciborinia camelliae]